MSIVYVLIMLAFWAVALLGLLGLLIACFTRKWTLALIIAAILAALVVYVVFKADENDPYIRQPVAVAELAGTYRPSPGANSSLQRVGYKVLTGDIEFRSDGTFVATRLPSCCATGEAMAGSPSTEYYDLSGTWETSRDESAAAIHFPEWKATLWRVSPSAVPVQINDRPLGLPPRINVIKGEPLSIAFQIFQNGDFYDLVYTARP